MSAEKGTNSGPELLVELDRATRRPLRAQLEDGLREAVRTGRLPARARLPATRALASDLGGLAAARGRRLRAAARRGLSRRAPRSGHVRGRRRRAPSPRRRSSPSPRAPTFDFFPGYPDLASFPRRAWLRAMRETLRRGARPSLRLPRPARRARAATGAGRAPAARARGRRRSPVDRRLLGCRAGLRAAGAGARTGRAWRSRTPGCRRIGRSWPRTAPRSCRSRSTSRGRACTSSRALRRRRATAATRSRCS